MLKRILLCAVFLSLSFAFSIPGVSLNTFKQYDPIPVDANELDSIRTQMNYEYYYLKFCDAKNEKNKEENLGSVLLGESTQATPYQLFMNEVSTCNVLCPVTLNEEEVKNFKWMIDEQYYVNLVIDNLPAIHHEGEYSHVGYPVGFTNADGEYYINNHLSFDIEIFEVPNTETSKAKTDTETPPVKSYRIVGFNVTPHSIESIEGKDEKVSICHDRKEKILPSEYKSHKRQIIQVGVPIFYSYDVTFHKVESDKSFGSRWDHYKLLGDERIHWFSLFNSLLISLILTLIIGYIMKRTVSNDIRMYNELRTSEEVEEDSGWKQLSRDVFRPPKYAIFLSVFAGTGIQLGSMIFLTLLLSAFGFMKQSFRGSIITTIVLFYNFMGIAAGYYSARFYKMWNGPRWIACTLFTALLYPGVNFLIFYVINFILMFEKSSSAVGLGTIIELLLLWFGISMPLVFLGSLVGYKKQTLQNPCKVNPVPKFIKPQPWYLRTYMLCILGGLLPFGSVFIELVYIMTSTWRQSFYYFFPFLFAVAIILFITCIEISIVITYLQLCNGNHKIWWRSFLTTGSMAVYIFLYAIFYYIKELQINLFSSMFLYFGYMLVVSLTFFILCGTIGFFSSYIFVKKIYSSIKID